MRNAAAPGAHRNAVPCRMLPGVVYKHFLLIYRRVAQAGNGRPAVLRPVRGYRRRYAGRPQNDRIRRKRPAQLRAVMNYQLGMRGDGCAKMRNAAAPGAHRNAVPCRMLLRVAYKYFLFIYCVRCAGLVRCACRMRQAGTRAAKPNARRASRHMNIPPATRVPPRRPSRTPAEQQPPPPSRTAAKA